MVVNKVSNGVNSVKKTAVTGGAGFIGSHLAEELAKSYQVIIIDDLSTGKMAYIDRLLKNENVTFVHGSITDLSLLQRLFRGVDCVFHQAAIPSVPRSIERPLVSHEANLGGTLNVLIAARDNGVRKVVYASSAAVYGDTPGLPVPEDRLPEPRSPYAVTKLAGEYYCQVFQEVYGLPAVCLRYFNVYGPRQGPDSQYATVIPRFISRVSQHNSPIIFGDGEQTRDFVFVEDVVAANILAAESEHTGCFNVGTGKSVSLNYLAGVVTHLMGDSIKPVHEEPRPGDVRHSRADISRARLFGYEPKWSLEAGLRKTINSMKDVGTT